MFGSSVLDVGVGLVFVYLTLSLVVTAINEAVAAFSRSRARHLKMGLVTLLKNQTPQSSFDEWSKQLFQQPLAEVIGEVRAWSNALAKPPVLSATTDEWVKHFFDHPLIAALSKPGATPSYIPAETFATVLLHLMQASSMDLLGKPRGENQATAPTISGNAKFDDVVTIIQSIKHPPLAAALLPLLEKARSNTVAGANEVKKFTNEIEGWYDQAMDRVGGQYKRRTQLVVLVVALCSAAILNVDTVAICHQLANDATLRASLVEAAKQAAAKPAPSLGGTATTSAVDADKARTDAAGKADKPKGTAPMDTDEVKSGAAGKTEKAKADGTMDTDIGANFKAIEKGVKSLDALGIPLGWSGFTWTGLPDFITKIAGILLTAFAASLGAPFWFDMLNKFMSIRSAGKAPEEKQKGPKKVPQPVEPRAN